MNQRRERAQFVMLLPLLVVIASIRLDPYSSGGKGGVAFVVFDWQIALGLAMIGLCLVAGAAIVGRNVGRAFRIAVIEAAIFVAANVAFLWRDGEDRFAAITHRPMPAAVLALGILARLMFLVWSFFASRKQVQAE